MHKATTDVVVLNGRGQELLHRQVESQRTILVKLIQSISGEKRVALESARKQADR